LTEAPILIVARHLSAFYAQRPDLKALFAPLIASMEAIEEQLRASNRLLNDRAKADSIEDPHRFARSEDVGAYAGLVPRRSQSGERDVSGHISKAGDPMLRKALYEAANVALSQVKRPFALQEWGRKMAEAKGPRRARTAVARKLAALLHSLWLNETEFRWV
jgi:transposase